MTNIVDSPEKRKELMEFLNSHDTFAFDIETSGLNPRKDVIIGFSVCTDRQGYYIPNLEWCPIKQDLKHCSLESRLAIQGTLQTLKTKKLITYNGAFDLPFTKNYFGVDLIDSLWCEAMILIHLLDENRFSYALKDVASELFGSEVKAEQQDLFQSISENGGSKKQYFMADMPILARYGVQDGILTAKIAKHYLAQLDETLHDFYFHQESVPLYKYVVIPMEMRGLKLDMPLLEQSKREIDLDILALEEKIQEAIAPHLGLFEEWFLNKDYPPSRSGLFAQGIATYFNLDLPKTASGKFSLTEDNIESLSESHPKLVLKKSALLTSQEVLAIQKLLWASEGQKYMFNLNSRHHMKKLLFDTLKCKPLSTTPTGQPQADELFLESVKDQIPWVKDLLVYNKLVKIQGTYINRFLEEQEDGRFYARYQQHRTVSGRLSGDFQQLTRPLELGQDHELVVKHTNNIRAFFIADEGCVLIDNDYNSAEPRIFGHIAQEYAIKAIFKRGDDFYSSMALLVEDLPQYSANKQAPNYLGKVNKLKRQQAKVYALGIPYSMSGYKLQYEIDVELEVAERLVKKYLNAFPNLKAWMDNTSEAVLRDGFVKSEAGRVRRFPRACQIYNKYGDTILNDLDLWKSYNDMPGLYAQAKRDRKELKNYIANGNNFQIQSLVASMINRASIEVAKEYKRLGLNAQIIAQLHDQLIVNVSEEHKVLAAQILQDKMENTMTFSVPMEAIPSFGYNMRDSKG